MSDIIAHHVGEQIHHYRKKVGLTQDELAINIGVPTNTVSRWEKAVYKPKLKDLDTLATYFGVSVSAFFPEPENTEGVATLMRAAKDLDDNDMNSLIDFAEYKRAQHLLKRK